MPCRLARRASSTQPEFVVRLTPGLTTAEGVSVKQTEPYEAPSVEEIDTGGYPISTAAGIISGTD
jgi:hypothetical protein